MPKRSSPNHSSPEPCSARPGFNDAESPLSWLHSRKGRDLAVNPNAALQFHWVELERVVLVEGTVARVSAAESDAYFAGNFAPANAVKASGFDKLGVFGIDPFVGQYRFLFHLIGKVFPQYMRQPGVDAQTGDEERAQQKCRIPECQPPANRAGPSHIGSMR